MIQQPETHEFFTRGIPVELNSIDQELKKLWQISDQIATRATRMNLVIYSAAEHSLRANTELVARIARQCAMRAIIVSAKPQANATGIRTWVNAHCQMSKDGKKQRCSEQIAFQLEGEARDLNRLPSLVFSHLDSDLPLNWWWQGELPSASLEQLFAWIDRFIFDSAEWNDPRKQIGILDSICAFKPVLKNSLSDLNWARLLDFRLALAHFFEPECTRPLLEQIETVELLHNSERPESDLHLLLLIGWLADRLGWKRVEASGSAGSGEVCYGFEEARVILKRNGDPEGENGNTLKAVAMKMRDGSRFSVMRHTQPAYLFTKGHLENCAKIIESRIAPVVTMNENFTANLVSEELLYSAHDPIYYRALEHAAALLR